MESAGRNDRVRRYLARLDHARASLADELAEDVAMLRGVGLSDRGRWVASACAAADAILRARKRMGLTAELDEPPAPDFFEKWRRLRQRFQLERRHEA
jgi:hypothetical protein